jgi:hypothetical protein
VLTAAPNGLSPAPCKISAAASMGISAGQDGCAAPADFAPTTARDLGQFELGSNQRLSACLGSPPRKLQPGQASLTLNVPLIPAVHGRMEDGLLYGRRSRRKFARRPRRRARPSNLAVYSSSNSSSGCNWGLGTCPAYQLLPGRPHHDRPCGRHRHCRRSIHATRHPALDAEAGGVLAGKRAVSLQGK